MTLFMAENNSIYRKAEKMMKDFKNVPKEYRPIPFWSWNEKLDVEESVRQVEEMNARGIGGFFMHARGGLQTEYMGEEWFANVEACIRKCEENGMYPWAYDENGWPSGFGSGIVNGKGVEYQQKYLRVEEGEKNTDRTIANVDGYHFYYDVNPFYVDTLDGKVIKEFIDNIYQPYYDRFAGRITGIFTDEPQISRDGIPWSFILPEEYEKRYEESLIERLPLLFFDLDGCKETRVKFWKLVCQLFSQNYMKQIYDWCTEHGMKFTGHLVLEESLQSQLTTNGACMPHYEYLTIPGMDWLGRHNIRSLTPYQVGSVARQLGKKQVLSETFAMCGHNIGHDELKWIFEHQMVRGINLLCQHLEGYSNRGLRKRDYPPAMYVQQPWWKDSKAFHDAMSRTGMLLTQGDDGVEVLVIHPQTTAWALCNKESLERIQKTAKGGSPDRIEELNEEFLDLVETLERKHVNFHLGDEILIERHGRVKGNRFVIGEKSYSTVILPRHDVLFENTSRLLKEFTENGGSIKDVEEIPANDIIDIPEITYCERHCDEYELYYFVNSTEDTFDAHIKVGNKRLDPVTGDLSGFDGHHVFRKYESLIVIDDHTGGKDESLTGIDDHMSRETIVRPSRLAPIDLGGEWNITFVSENILTMDYCDYYFDEELIEKNGYILNATYRALDLCRPVKIRCEYKVRMNYIPRVLYLLCETPEIFEIQVNGEKIEKTDCGYFADKAFRKLDITRYVKYGENGITVSVDFRQSDAVYEGIRKSRIFESEKNKLTFDMEIEQIYLLGDFSVDATGSYEELDRDACRFSGDFVIEKPRTAISLEKIQRQGFPFFAGEITVKKNFSARDTNLMLDFVKTGINCIKAKINGNELPQFMWEPYTADVSGLVREGENEIELTLVNNLRNMQGPLHLAEGECYRVAPASFYKEDCLWVKDVSADRWNDDYCFVNVSVKNREG